MTEEEKKTLYRQVMEGCLKQDIVVVEDMNQMSVMNEEYLLKYIYIGMCVSGYSIGKYDYQDYYFKAGDICWLMPDHVLRHDEVSSDYNVVSVYIDKGYYEKLNRQGGLPHDFYPFFIRSVSLTPQHFNLMLCGFRMIGQLTASSSSHRDELICKMCDILAVLGDEYIKQQHPDFTKTQKRHIQLFERFYDAITKHYWENREVSYYAGLLSLTPKYFATVIKQVTGKSASEWINGYVIVQMKWKLQHEYQKSIQQIAHQLGFSEQASFSRFFKDNTGMSPSAYRAGI